MRALLTWALAFGLAVSPAIAGAKGSDDPAAATDSDTSASASASAKPAAKADSAAAKPATPSTESELEELRSVLESQANQLHEQNDQLKATQEKIDAIEKQLKASSAASAGNTAPAVPAPAPAATISAPTPNLSVGSATVGGLVIPAESSSASVPAAESSSSSPAEPQALPAAKGVNTAALTNNNPYALPPTYGTNPALPEPQGASPLSFHIGGAEFTPGGFMDLTDVFRTKDNGGSIGTSFSGILYKIPANYPLAGSTEDKFSAQNSRISLRVDSEVAGGKVAGYLETDFLGNAATSLNTTSNSSTLRLRLYFVDYTRGHFEFLGGQDWSMFVSNRNGIGFMPGDVFYSQDMDTNYQLGLLWERAPQFRFVFHPNMDWAMGISMEDPDQYIASGVTIPSGASGGSAPITNQFDPTTGTPNAPNLLPDIVAKIAYDHMISGHHIHIEGEGDFRTFRVVNYTAPSTNSVINGPSEKMEGAVGAINSNWEIFKNFKIYENADWGDGDGRLIANAGVPDVIIRPVTPGSTTGPYTASPLHAGAFIGGFEYQATPKFFFYGYDGGVYIDKYVGYAGTAAFGWGVPTTTAATAEAQNRFMYEPTLGIVITMWRNPQYGALQLITQGSYIQRAPWVVVPGTPHVATDTMAWADVRYTLP